MFRLSSSSLDWAFSPPDGSLSSTLLRSPIKPAFPPTMFQLSARERPDSFFFFSIRNWNASWIILQHNLELPTIWWDLRRNLIKREISLFYKMETRSGFWKVKVCGIKVGTPLPPTSHPNCLVLILALILMPPQRKRRRRWTLNFFSDPCQVPGSPSWCWELPAAGGGGTEDKEIISKNTTDFLTD